MQRDLRVTLAAFVLALGLGAGVALHFHALSAGFSGADESAHFLNAYLVKDYLAHGLAGNPVAFAADLYLHYPKISIGHWPPFYYLVVGPVFALTGATTMAAMWVNVVVATLPVLFVSAMVLRAWGAVPAVLAGLVYVLLPLSALGYYFFMLDQPLTALVAAAASLWLWFASGPTYAKALAFAAVAAAAVLLKGNGWLVGLVPPLHIALTGAWRLLRDPRLYVAAALALAATVPWYLLTFRISAQGFNYEPGLPYARMALDANLAGLLHQGGPVGAAAAALGAAVSYVMRRREPETWQTAALCIAMIVATLAMQSIIPADIDARYLVPAVPPLLVLGAFGTCALHRFLARRIGAWIAGAVAAAVCLLSLAPAGDYLAREPGKVNLRLGEVAQNYVMPSGGGIWLVSGSSGAEGALIAEVAARDPRHQAYVLRASKLMANSDFMGDQYQLTIADPAKLDAVLAQLGVAGIVTIDRTGMATMPHQKVLDAALGAAGSAYAPAATLAHFTRAGVTRVYVVRTPTTPNLDMLKSINFPEKASSLF